MARLIIHITFPPLIIFRELLRFLYAVIRLGLT